MLIELSENQYTNIRIARKNSNQIYLVLQNIEIGQLKYNVEEYFLFESIINLRKDEFVCTAELHDILILPNEYDFQ